MAAKSCWFAACLLLTAACSGDEGDTERCESSVGNVSGNAYLADGPALGAVVTLSLGGESVSEGGTASGEFGLEAPPGTYRLEGEAEGCTSTPIDVDVVACTSQFIDLQLDQCSE